MTSYYSGARWLDGPRICRWIEAQGVTRPPTLVRRMREWRLGMRADFYTLDPHLCEWDIHPSEIPDECWAEAPEFYKRTKAAA